MEDITRSAEKKANEGSFGRSFPAADEAIEKAKAKGEAMWDKAKTKGQDLLDDVESNSQQVLGQIKGLVQKRPLQALGYAVAVGLLIGVVFSPKGRD